MQYKDGTVTIEAGTNIVTGTGTLWLANINVSLSPIIRMGDDAVLYTVGHVTSDTQLELTANYPLDVTGEDYVISQDFTTNRGYPVLHQGDTGAADLMARMANMIDQDMSAALSDSMFANTGMTGLDFEYAAGKVRVGVTTTTVTAGSVTLSDDATNYVEVDSAGTVSKNTTAFTDGKEPLYVVVMASGVASSIVDHRTGFAKQRASETPTTTAGQTHGLTATQTNVQLALNLLSQLAMKLVPVASIVNPATELGAIQGDHEGAQITAVVLGTGSTPPTSTDYVWTAATVTVSVPYVVAGLTGKWIAKGGAYKNQSVTDRGDHYVAGILRVTSVIRHLLDLEVLNKAAAAYVKWATRNTTNTEVQMILTLIQSLSLQSPDTTKTVVQTVGNDGILNLAGSVRVTGELLGERVAFTSNFAPETLLSSGEILGLFRLPMSRAGSVSDYAISANVTAASGAPDPWFQILKNGTVIWEVQLTGGVGYNTFTGTAARGVYLFSASDVMTCVITNKATVGNTVTLESIFFSFSGYQNT